MFDTKEMQTKFISNMAERLNTMNFRTKFREDGDLTVSSSINFLGVVGKTGELYCNSKDLGNPYRRFQLERILQTIDAVHTEMVQANTSTPEEALKLETLLGAYPSRQQAQAEKPRLKQNENAALKMVHERSSEKNPSQSNLPDGLPELCFSVLASTLMELNDLAAQLTALDKVQGVAFDGLLRMEVQKKIDTNGGIITMQDMRDLAVSAGTDCYHVVDAADDAALGRFYAENDFIPELEGVSDAVFKLLDFSKIGKKIRQAEKGIFVGNLYVLWDGELAVAPPCPKGLPPKPDYLFRLTLGLHPDMGDDRTVVLTLPAPKEELNAAQERLGTLKWENIGVLDYDGIFPNAALLANLPMELEAFNELAAVMRDMPSPEKQLPKLKALLEQFEVQDIATAMSLTEHLEDYILTPEISSPQETAIDQLHFMTDDHSAELLISHVNLYAYGCDIIREDNASLTPYGLLHRTDYQPMLAPIQQSQGMEMKMR